MGEPTIILGSFQTASDLLDVRGKSASTLILSSGSSISIDTKGMIYSDRPRAIMAGELSVSMISSVHAPEFGLSFFGVIEQIEYSCNYGLFRHLGSVGTRG